MTPRETSLHALPFSDDFVDVAALNAQVSARLVERVEKVQRAARNGENIPSKAIAVLGPAGGGKTHLFARLRHHLETPATPILLRPYFGVSVSLRDVLAAVVDQLCLPVRGAEATHLDVLTAHWRDADDDRPVEEGIAKLVSLIPEIAPAAHLVRAVLELRARDRSSSWAELAWLSGREPRPKVEDGSASPLSEGDVLHMLRLLAVLAAPVAPLVITFDQLENLAGSDDSRVLGYANLVSEMVDSLPCLTIVQLALTSEWMQFIEPRLSLPQKTRLASQTWVLETPNREERELLLRAWHDRIGPTVGGRKKRFPHPLTADDLTQLLTAPGMTPRLLLGALTRLIAGEKLVTPSSESLARRDDAEAANDLVNVWSIEGARVQKEVEDKERSSLPFDGAELAEGLTSSLSFVANIEVTTRTERDRIQTRVRSPGHELTVLYLTSLHHLSVASTLSKAADLAQTMKVVIVREQRFQLPRTWETVNERREAFERLPNARWLWLSEKDTADWLTLARLLSQARANKLRRTGSDETFAIAELREEIQRTVSPAEWQSTVSISRWLSDVPRDQASPASPKVVGRREAAVAERETSQSEPSLRAWLSQGRELGRAVASRYVAKLRTLTRR